MLTVMPFIKVSKLEVHPLVSCICFHFQSVTAINYVFIGPEAVRRAIAKARDVYLNDSLNIFRQNHVWFRTNCEHVDGQLFSCLILPPQNRGEEIGIMFDVTRESPLYYTHAIELNDGRACDRTRLIVKIRQSREACLNPFDVRFENGAVNDSHLVSHIFIVVC